MMIAVNHNDFHNLRNILMSSSTENIIKLRTLYKKEINSTRMMNSIQNIKELIEILEKRTCISENDINILIEIAQQIANTNFFTYYYNIDNLAEPIREPIINSNFNSGYTIDVNEKIHAYICKSMGKKWLDLARAVEITETEIDDICVKHGSDFVSCTNEVLLLHKNNAHPRNWRLQLLQGLSTARRKDIREAVERILNDEEVQSSLNHI